MKKTLLISMLMLWCSGHAFAEKVDNYTETFNRPLNVSDHAFAPRGWTHIVGSYNSYGTIYYVSYSQPTSGGQDDGAFLRAGTQKLSYSAASEVQDLLVTPELRGDVGFWVRKPSAGATSSLTVYDCSYDDNGNLSVGNEHALVDGLELTAEWQLVTIEISGRDNYLGFRLNNVDFDDFTCVRAYPELFNELSIESLTATGGSSVDATSEGTFTVSIDALLKNTGDFALSSETDFSDSELQNTGYTIDLLERNSQSVLSSVGIAEALDLDATTTQNISTTLNVAEFPLGSISIDVRENVSGKVFEGPTLSITPYEVIPSIVRQGGETELQNGSTEFFGVSNTAIEKSFVLTNKGAAPMTIEGVDLPNGYELASTHAFPVDVEAHAAVTLSVRMKADEVGEQVGNMTIRIADNEAIVLALHGAVPAESQWHADFEEGKIPANMTAESGWAVGAPNWRYGLASNYWAQQTTNSASRLITPMLNVSDGDALSFSAAMRASGAEVKVYYSTDRTNWTLAETFDGAAADEAHKISDENWGYNCYAVKRFSVTGLPAGQLYFAFEGKQVYIDDILGPEVVELAHDFMFAAETIPARGTVNHDSEMKVTVKNVNTKDESGADYSLKLLIDDEAVVEAAPADLASGEQKEFSFTYTPHTSGTKSVRFEITTADGLYAAATQAVTYEVADEVATGETVVAEANAASAKAPVNFRGYYSQTETIYPAEKINLESGSKITSLTWKGYTSGLYTNRNATNLEVWIANTEETEYGTNPTTSTEGMTQVYGGSYAIVSGGTAAAPIDRISITLDEPFEYTGKSLKVYVHLQEGSMSYSENSFFEADNTLTANTIHRMVSTPMGSIASASYEVLDAAPVLHVGATVMPNTVSGTATFEETGAAAEGVAVRLTSGNVVYEATTGADGSYSIPVYQSELDYEMTATLTGFMPITKKVNVKDGSIKEDLVLAPADRLGITTIDIPAKSTVNHEITVTANVINPTAETISDYTATLYLNNKAVATAESVVLASGEEATLTFNCYPHEAGTLPAYIEVKAGEKTSQSETVNVDVAEEIGGKFIQVLENKARNNNAVSNYSMNKFNLYDWYYTPEQLGIAKGTKIHALTLRGYSNSTVTMTNKLYMENMTDETLPTGNPVESMTLVGSGTTDITRVGTTNATVDLFTITFDEPFVYDGGYLHFALASEFTTASPSIYFEMDNSFNKARKANGSSDMTTVANPSWTLSQQTVVGYIMVDDFLIASDIVTDGDTKEPISGAEVKLVHGGVEYAAVTNDEGKYILNVVQKELSYNIIITATDYLMAKDCNIELAENNIELVKAITFDAGQMSTIVLPVALDAAETAAIGTFYEVKTFNAETLSIMCESVATTEANKPYIFIPTDEKPFDFSEFDLTDAVAGEAEADEAWLVGTFVQKTFVPDEASACFGLEATAGEFVRIDVTEGAWCPQYRAYITIPIAVIQTADRLTVVLDGHVPTGIANENIKVTQNEEVKNGMYNLSHYCPRKSVNILGSDIL